MNQWSESVEDSFLGFRFLVLKFEKKSKPAGGSEKRTEEMLNLTPD